MLKGRDHAIEIDRVKGLSEDGSLLEGTIWAGGNGRTSLLPSSASETTTARSHSGLLVSESSIRISAVPALVDLFTEGDHYRYWSGDFWMYGQGAYYPVDEDELKGRMYKLEFPTKSERGVKG